MKKVLITLLILLVLPILVLSQDAEPTLTADDLYDWSATVNFPQEIEFELFAIGSDAVVSSITLTITTRGVEPIIIDIDSVATPISDQLGVFRYRWDIPTDEPPPLFSRVRYTWDIVTVNGVAYKITDDLDFVDQRLTWVQANDLQSQVNIFHAVNRLNANQVRTGIRETYNLLFADSNDKPLYTLLVYPENVDIGCELDDDDEPIIMVRGDQGFEEIRCDLALANDIYEQGDYIVFNQSSESGLQKTIIDLLVREYYLEQWGDRSVPDWFLYGLQQFYHPTTKRSSLILAQQKSRADDLLRYDDLVTIPDDDNVNRELWNAQSIGLVLYLADTFGVDELFEFADSIGDFETFDEAFEDYVRQSFDLFMLSWRDWLFLPSSQQDYEYHPYLPMTQTPTPTATSTNTPTATFTPSKTPNVTATTRPSITPLPPPPTTTPLPAQSFSVQPTDAPSPTPAPVEPEPFTVDDGLLMRAAMGGAVILGLLVLLYFILRRR